ncbi:MAG: DUF6089 family protein [Bacteroidota bacterium]
MKKLILTLVIGLYCLSINAQQGFEAGGWIGVSNYFGDLNTSFNISQPGLALGLIGRYNFNNRVCMKLSANYGTLRGDDAESDNSFEQIRNLSFRSRVFDGTLQFEFNFLPYNHGSKDEFFTPYLFAGFSVLHFNPKAQINDEWVELRTLGTEGQFRGEEYYSITGAMTYGIGFKVDLSYEWSINIELGARNLFSDYIDDVSGLYPDKDDLESLRGPLAVQLSDRSPEVIGEPIGEVGRQRGNGRTNDKYTMLGIGLVYYFGDIRCPAYSR